MSDMRFGLSKINYILMAVSLVIIIAGFLLMTGEPSDEVFNPDIFSKRRIVVAPMVSLTGFVMMIVAIMYKPKNRRGTMETMPKVKETADSKKIKS